MLLVYLVRHGSLLNALWEAQERGTDHLDTCTREAPLHFESAQPSLHDSFQSKEAPELHIALVHVPSMQADLPPDSAQQGLITSGPSAAVAGGKLCRQE